ncbi:hypothetical protein SZN_27596 [Streptomyces zinciresistens K42]|uniref:Integral membrane protein n=1 Tax=Streptomyces zinciresistens K42 TaxID=700597 RepID=G2GJ29_9ACTN|nr:hypothetical protein [Streptomyces zinciresistens]EGX56492.1 hypothetical protein SZN_27596 [Streptomyces zinciresistens K42]
MAVPECRNVRLWRWRRSPLRRRSDVVEAWLVLCGWLLAVVGAVFAGLAASAAVAGSAQQQRAESRRVTAVLVKDARDAGAARVSTDNLVWAAVRWTGPDGTRHTGDARVSPDTRAGARVTVWTDRRGIIVSEPLSGAEILLHSVSGGILAGGSAAGVVLGATWAARQGLERRRLAQWAAEWERVDTPWGWKTG